MIYKTDSKSTTGLKILVKISSLNNNYRFCCEIISYYGVKLFTKIAPEIIEIIEQKMTILPKLSLKSMAHIHKCQYQKPGADPLECTFGLE